MNSGLGNCDIHCVQDYLVIFELNNANSCEYQKFEPSKVFTLP